MGALQLRPPPPPLPRHRGEGKGECVGVSSLFPPFLLSPRSLPLPLHSGTKALCTLPLPLAAVSEPRPYENHMGERGWKGRGWGGRAARPSSHHLPPLALCAGGWHTLPQTPPKWTPGAGMWGTEGWAQSRAGGPEGRLCSRTAGPSTGDGAGKGPPLPPLPSPSPGAPKDHQTPSKGPRPPLGTSVWKLPLLPYGGSLRGGQLPQMGG